MTFTKGGRGRQAPYTSTHVRVPDPLKSEVEQLIWKWRELIESGEFSPTEAVSEVMNVSDNCQISIDDAINQARKIVSQKKSATESLAKLLTSIYGVEVSKEDLKK